MVRSAPLARRAKPSSDMANQGMKADPNHAGHIRGAIPKVHWRRGSGRLSPGFMMQHRDIVLVSPSLDAQEIARYAEMFAYQCIGWMFPAEQSVAYEQKCQKPSCCIVVESGILPHAAIHMTMKRGNSLYVANIVPLDQNELSLAQYNAVATEFARSIRAYAKKTETPIEIKLSKAEIKLADVVTGKIPKRLLDRYLSMYPLSYHPLDMDRLDAFICALSRYSRKPFDLEAFEYLLKEELDWFDSDAAWCRNRVEIGLAVLTANRKYNGC